MTSHEKGSMREALVIEAIGDAGKLLDGIERLLPTLKATHHAMTDTALELTERIAEFKPQITNITQKAMFLAIKEVARSADQAALGAHKRLELEMQEATRAMFQSEANRALARFAKSVEEVQSRQRAHWSIWAIFILSGAASAACMWLLLTWL